MIDYIFLVLSFLLIFFSFLVCTVRNLVHAAIYLFFSLFLIAGLYILLMADFLAAVQVIVYVGGILVLIIFGVMLTNKLERPSINISSMNQFLAAFLCISFFIVQCFAIVSGNWMDVGVNEIDNSTEYIGNLILSDYLLPFEVVSLLLLGAMVGAATIARKKR